MNQYLFDIALPDQLTEEFVSLIPSQRLHIDTLMVKGVVTSYGLAHDRSRVWVTMRAESEERAHEIVRRFPLFRFFTVRLYPLAFHNMTHSFTNICMN